jgi:HK97 family phage portal protein
MSIFRELFATHGASLFNRDHPHWTEGNTSIGKSTKSGEVVSPGNALTLSAYFAAMRAISEDVGKMPWELFRQLDNGNKELALSDPRFFLTNDEPNSETGRMAFKETVQSWALGWGNGYAHIVRDSGANPTAMWQIHPSRVKPIRLDMDDSSTEIVYEVQIGDKSENRFTIIPFEDMFHLHGLGDDGLVGYSILQMAADSLGIGLATQNFKAAFFGNGTAFGRVIEHPAQLSETARANLRNSISEIYQGAGKGFQNLVLDEGMKLATNNGWISPEDAQLLQESEFSVNEVARWFRIPPHKIQQLLHPTFNTLEQQNQEYTNDTLGPWLERWDAEAERKLLFDDEKRSMFWDHDMFSLVKGDFKTRADVYNKMIFSGVMMPNEARSRENMNNDNENGDQQFMQTSMGTLDSIAEGTANTGGSNAAPGFGRPSGAVEDIKQSFEPLFIDCVARVMSKEEKAVAQKIERFKGNEDEFAAWRGDFFIRLQDDTVNALGAAFQAFDQALSRERGEVHTLDVQGFARDHVRGGLDRAAMAYTKMLSVDEIYNEETNRRIAAVAMLHVTERYEDA